MTTTPNIQKALNTTVQDFRALGEAAKTDFQSLSHEAQYLAQEKVIQPGVQLFKDTTNKLEERARHSADLAKIRIDHLREYIVENPGRAVAGALVGGVIVGLLLRR